MNDLERAQEIVAAWVGDDRGCWIESELASLEASLAYSLAAARQEGAALALRASMTPVASGHTDEQIAQTRDEALEEAARICERRRDETGPREAYAVLDVESYTSACSACAFDIRALKDKGDG